jgi:hypothetical protein
MMGYNSQVVSNVRSRGVRADCTVFAVSTFLVDCVKLIDEVLSLEWDGRPQGAIPFKYGEVPKDDGRPQGAIHLT